MQDDLAGLWPVSSIIAECKAQARQTLDPGFTRFMNAAATTLEAQAREIAELLEAAEHNARALRHIAGADPGPWSSQSLAHEMAQVAKQSLAQITQETHDGQG